MSYYPDWIQTYTGKKFYPKLPDTSLICIEDIAHALSIRARFCGHADLPITVAQHSCLVALACPDGLQLEGLLHDAAEAYIGDIVAPLKRSVRSDFREYIKQMEENLMFHISHALLGFSADFGKAEIHNADMRALVTEVRDFLPFRHPDWVTPDVEPLFWRSGGDKPLPLTHIESERQFLYLFDRLKAGNSISTWMSYERTTPREHRKQA